MTGIGIASVAHQETINSATAATSQASEVNPEGDGVNKIPKKRNTPIQNPLFLIAINIL